MKYLIDDWGLEAFRAEVERRLGRRLAADRYGLLGMLRAVRTASGSVIAVALVTACSATPVVEEPPEAGAAPPVEAQDVRDCLTDALGPDGWAEIPLSETGTVYGVDFGANSVQLFIESDASAVADQIASIRAAEDEHGNTAPEDRVILSDRGNVLVSWASEPTAEQRAVVERCVGFA